MANEWSLWSGMIHQVALEEIYRTKETSRKAVLTMPALKVDIYSLGDFLCVSVSSFLLSPSAA
jgi:hypothetical protein